MLTAYMCISITPTGVLTVAPDACICNVCGGNSGPGVGDGDRCFGRVDEQMLPYVLEDIDNDHIKDLYHRVLEELGLSVIDHEVRK